MEQHHSDDLFSLHADGLITDTDRTADLIEQVPPAERVQAHELFGLARDLRQALVPSRPQPAFVARVKSQLETAWPTEMAAAAQRHNRRREVVLAAAGVGGVLSVLGLGFLTFRAAGALIGKISAIMTERSARSALTKVQPVP